MNETITYIEKRIDKCFAHLIATISLEELEEFQIYIAEQELLIPLLQADIAGGLELVRQRVESLKNVLEAEEKRINKPIMKKVRKK